MRGLEESPPGSRRSAYRTGVQLVTYVILICILDNYAQVPGSLLPPNFRDLSMPGAPCGEDHAVIGKLCISFYAFGGGLRREMRHRPNSVIKAPCVGLSSDSPVARWTYFCMYTLRRCSFALSILVSRIVKSV